MKIRLAVPALAAVLMAPAAMWAQAGAAAAPSAKIGVIDVQVAITSTAEGKQAAAELQSQFAPRQTELTNMQKQMEDEIKVYDLLKTEIPSALEERSIEDLPKLLIEFKILSGLTQKEFSRKIGMKEQQLQRYEADNFSSISFKNLLKILHAVGLEITVKGNASRGTTQPLSRASH